MLAHSERVPTPNDINLPLFKRTRTIIARIQRIETSIVIEIYVRYCT